jgi:predicted cupin superfamily sugar epimerase
LHPEAAGWIRVLGLTPHPEGGFFRETYRADETIASAHLPARFGGERAFATAIYFLLEGWQISRLHRIRSDELWHFHAGGPVAVDSIAPDGALGHAVLGPEVEAGQVFQHVVPAGHWFGAALERPASYALVGCTVAPGFDFAELELAHRDALLAQFPQHRALIERLTP